MMVRIPCTIALLGVLAGPASGHHSVLHYDGKQEVVISGTVVAGKFAFPHSVYLLDVESDDGGVERWTVRTEDPKDAEHLGFAKALKSLEVGDRVTVVGWPHRFEEMEIRGHQLHFSDGSVVFLRRGNYIWPEDIKRIGRLVENPRLLAEKVRNVDTLMLPVERIVAWAEEDDPVVRVAFEITRGRSKLIGIDWGDGVVFAGVEELLKCHTLRSDFVMTIDFRGLSDSRRRDVENALAYTAEYNRLLSRWWEQKRSSCG